MYINVLYSSILTQSVYCVRLSCILNEYVIGRIMRMFCDKFRKAAYTLCNNKTTSTVSEEITSALCWMMKSLGIPKLLYLPRTTNCSKNAHSTTFTSDNTLEIRVVFYPRHVTQQHLVVTPCLPVKTWRSEAMLAPSTFSASWPSRVSLSLYQITECSL